MPQAPLVDSHFHIYTTDLPLTDTAWHHPPTDAGVDLLLDTFDKHGVTFGVVAAASLQGTYNDHVRRAMKLHKRLRATAILEPSTDLYQIEQMTADGFVGIRLMWTKLETTPDLSSGEWRAFLRRIADFNWHVHLNDQHARYEKNIAAIENAGPRVVVDHLGRPNKDNRADGPAMKAILKAVERGKTWVKLSGGFRVDPPSIAKEVAQAFVRHAGPERLVWGSDWPFAAFEDRVTYADCLKAFEEWVPDPAIRWKIGGETPLRLYFT